MKRADVFPSKYVATPDLQGQPRVLTVARVVMETIKDRGGDVTKPIMYFNGATKGLVLNVTNWNACEIMWGAESDAWVGNVVELYPDKTQFGHEIVDCIRMRGPTQVPAANPAMQHAAAVGEPLPATTPQTGGGADPFPGPDDIDDGIPFATPWGIR